MSFHFSLATVLKLRETIERREYLALERILMEIAYAEAQLREVDEWLSLVVQRRQADLAEGLPSIHLQGLFEQELALEHRRDALRLELEKLMVKRQQHVKAYELARQKREMLNELRARQLDAYTRNRARREQSAIDDLFLSRRKRDH
jgi:flagellar export protein FliJ